MQFHRGKKSHKSLFESVSRNTWKYMKLKYVDQLRKKTSIVSSWSRSHSPIDNCSMVADNCHSSKRHKCVNSRLNFNYFELKMNKSQVTLSYKCRLCSHSQQQSRRQYGFFSRSAKPAGVFTQLHNKLICISFWMATEVIVFLHCFFFCDCKKNPKKRYFRRLHFNIVLFPLSASFLAVLLCKILESRWVFKSVHRHDVLIFHSSSPFARWQFS